MTSAAVEPRDLRHVDPIALAARWQLIATWVRLRAAPGAASTLALVWAAVLASGAVAALLIGSRIGSAALDRHAALAALLLLLATHTDHSRAALRWLRGWRTGWLAALPGTELWIARALARHLLLRAAAHATAVALVIAGSIAAGASPPQHAAPLVPLLLAPFAAATLAWWRLRARGTRVLLAGMASRRRASVAALTALPPLARWQQVAALQSSRGAGGARAFGVLLLLIPFGASLHHTLAAILLMALAGSLLSAWAAALRTLPAAAALLHATPCAAWQLLRAGLALPLALLLSTLALLVAALLWAGVPGMAALLGAALLGSGSLHAAVVAAERLRPRRITPVFGLHAGLQVAVLQTLPPLAPLLLVLQVGWLLHRALRA